MTTQEISQFTGLLDVESGELLPVTTDNIGRVLNAARAMKSRVDAIIREATDAAVHISKDLGTKTLHGEQETVTLSGGTSTVYDPSDLMEALAAADCPQERIDQAVVTQITYKVNHSVLRELRAANPDYAAAIELAAREVEKPYQATVKLRRNDG